MSVTLGGKLYNVVVMESRTVLMDAHQTAMVRRLGLDKILPDPDANDDGAEWLIRLHAGLVDTCKVPQLLGMYLLPLGHAEADWTPELAAETARQIEHCNTADDRELVLSLAMEFVFGFFARELRLLKTFQRSLAENVPA